MKIKIFYSILVFLTFSPLLFSQKNIAKNYKTEKFNIAIFPKSYGKFLPKNRFTPSKIEIDKAELKLLTELKVINKNHINQSSGPVIEENLIKYKRQYFGCIDKDGKKYLLINSFLSDNEKPKMWLNTFYLVNDGGSYYWQIKYYINDDELKDLHVNGFG
ncbi:hypothetical protein [Halpernia frigidisoli]|uniref:Uncharacterized protein n=1 Tax=Halpernia frigidisoli TaxID=1125876 RepID=A0A1I3IHM2_9FLAO|nr:hypothetical protein [Halpernia frigidisoli]SFI47416.1 hypothetical protein SAMN05443292_2613 [Halpernia frigidisoli]